jgi:hypothetical protein
MFHIQEKVGVYGFTVGRFRYAKRFQRRIQDEIPVGREWRGLGGQNQRPDPAGDPDGWR